MLLQKTIAFIGAGNMASNLIGGLIESGIDPNAIWATRRDATKLAILADQLGIKTTTDNNKAVQVADVIILATKPHHCARLCQGLFDEIQARKPLVISVVAGLEAKTLQAWLGDNIAIVRAMPNTPTAIRCGATALYAMASVNAEQREIAQVIARAVGMAIWIDNEDDMHTITALSGSGPAYFYLFMEQLARAATAMGLPEKTAQLLTAQTAFGASQLALKSGNTVAELRAAVTSPKGTTASAIQTFCDKGLDNIVECAIKKARQRSVELATQLNSSEE